MPKGRFNMRKMTKSHVMLAVTGIAVAVAAFLLTRWGNPKNMGFCIACFIRDIAGAMKFHSAAPVQYLRPEILGIVLGSFVMSLVRNEFKPRGGSAPALRFLIGAGVMIGALVFLGCPLRMIIRLAGGDLNALVGFAGFALGIGFGSFFLNQGFSLGKSDSKPAVEGAVAPAVQVGLIILVASASSLFVFSQKGPGSMHAPVYAALIAALIVGALSQMSRICCAGGIRDIYLTRDLTLFVAPFTIFVVLTILNLIGKSYNFGFAGAESVAHSDHLWNLLSMFAVGLGSIMLGGCPLRQLVLAGEGNSDSFITCIGMFVGAAISHNFGLAGVAGQGATSNGKVAVCVIIAFFACVAALISHKNRRA